MKNPFENLPATMQMDIIAYIMRKGINLIPENLTAHQCIKYWLNENGIHGRAIDIQTLVLRAYGVVQ